MNSPRVDDSALDMVTCEARVLNRIIRWTVRGLEYEADPRQHERMLLDFELGPGIKTSATPGIKPLAHQIAEERL